MGVGGGEGWGGGGRGDMKSRVDMKRLCSCTSLVFTVTTMIFVKCEVDNKLYT